MNGRYGNPGSNERSQHGGRGGRWRPREEPGGYERDDFEGRDERGDEGSRERMQGRSGAYGREYDDFGSRSSRGWSQLGGRRGMGGGTGRSFDEDETAYGGETGGFDPGGYGGYGYRSDPRAAGGYEREEAGRRFGVGAERGGQGSYGETGFGGYGGGQSGYGGYGGQGREGGYGVGSGREERGGFQRGQGQRGAGWESGGLGRGGLGPFAGRGPKGYRRSDERVLEEVNQALEDHPDIDASNIEVSCQSGEIVLRGTVDDRRTKRLAEECVEDLPGVKDVRNELRVQSASGDGNGGSSVVMSTGATTAGSTPRSGSSSSRKSGEDE